MLKKIALALTLLTISATGASAEEFYLKSKGQIHACYTKSVMAQMVKASVDKNYGAAAGRVLRLQSEACPEKGPFRHDTLNAKVISSERLDDRNYDRLALVEWRFTGNNRRHYSFLMRSRNGYWVDFVDAVMSARTTRGVIDWLRR